MIHFNKEEFTFSRFISEMCTYNPGIKELKVIGTDLEKAIFNGFASQIAGVKVLLCVLHLQKNDKAKLSELSPKGSTPSINRILADIYGRRYGTIKELGLADSKDPMELSERLEKLKESWEKLCPGFYGWFVRNQKPLFEKSVIESARTNTNFQGLFYNNGIESQHFIEKKEQSFKKEDIAEVAETLKRIVERQQNDEIRRLYGSGPYHLAEPYKKFAIDPVKWHSYDPEKRRKLVEKFRNHRPSLAKVEAKVKWPKAK